MKKIILSLFLLLFVISCGASKTAIPPQSEGANQAPQQKSEGLAAELAEVKSVLGYIIEVGMRSSYEQVKQEIANANKVHDLKIGDSPSIGNPNAKLVIVEFTEFQCPFCARVAPVLDSIVRANPDKIRLVYKHFPLSFHKEAPAASAAAIAAQRQGKFWEYRWALAPHYNNLTDSTFIAVAQQIGLNIERFKKDMVLDVEKQAIIDRDMVLGMEVGVQGTPNFYINGKRQDRFSPQLVEQMLKELY